MLFFFFLIFCNATVAMFVRDLNDAQSDANLRSARSIEKNRSNVPDEVGMLSSPRIVC